MFSRVQFRTGTKKPDLDTDPDLLIKNVVIKKDIHFDQEFMVEEYLGSGKFGEVKRCKERSTNRQFAAKFVPIASKDDAESVHNEIAIMNTLRHPRLIQLYEAYETKREITMVLELITGGELFERIIDESFDLNESRCIKFMLEILQGVEYIHSQNVLHLDLKPENILCLSLDSFKIKIIDFGLARFYKDEKMCVLFGTPEFVSPEVISYDPVTPAADMWSVGVICYVMLSGLSPFMGDSQGETLANIMRVKYNFNYPEFAEISQDALDFIKKLLVKDPKKRLTASECLQHRWIKKKKLVKRSGTVSKKRLKHFVYRRKWQKAVNAIIALIRMGVVLQHSPLPVQKSNNQPLKPIQRPENKPEIPKVPQSSKPQATKSQQSSVPKPTSDNLKKVEDKSKSIFRRGSIFKTRNEEKQKPKLSNTSEPDLPKNNGSETSKFRRKDSLISFTLKISKGSRKNSSTKNPEPNELEISNSASRNDDKLSKENSPSTVTPLKSALKNPVISKIDPTKSPEVKASEISSAEPQSSSSTLQSHVSVIKPKNKSDINDTIKFKPVLNRTNYPPTKTQPKKSNLPPYLTTGIAAKVNFFSKLSKD